MKFKTFLKKIVAGAVISNLLISSSLYYLPIIPKAKATQTTPIELRSSNNSDVTDGVYNQNTVLEDVYNQILFGINRAKMILTVILPIVSSLNTKTITKKMQPPIK